MKINKYIFSKATFILFLLEQFLMQFSLVRFPMLPLLLYLCLSLMICSIFLNLKNFKYIPFPILFFVSLMSIYFLIFELSSLESFFYLLSKGVSLLFIALLSYQLIKNNDVKFLLFMRNVLLCVIFFSALLPDHYGGRATGVLGNANELGSTAVLTLIFVLNTHSKRWFYYLCLVLCVYVVLISGSRAAFIGMAIVFALLNKISLKVKVLYSLVFALSFGILTSSISTLQRFEGEVTNTRSSEWNVATYIISKKPYFGGGLQSYSGTDKDFAYLYDETKALGAHNGYLTLVMMFGIPLSSILIFVFIYPFRELFIRPKYFIYSGNSTVTIAFTGAVTLFVLAMAETFFTGVNSLQASLFLFLYTMFIYSSKSK